MADIVYLIHVQPDRRSMKKFLKMLDVVFEKNSRDEKLARIRQLNKDLRIIVSGGRADGIIVADLRVPRGINPATRYKRVRTQAIAIYQVMEDNFKKEDPDCICQVKFPLSLFEPF